MSHGPPNWSDWFDRHGPALTLFARQFAGGSTDAQDAVQEGFVRFWRFGPDRVEDPLAYLYSCVKRAAMDGRRSDERRRRRDQATALERPEADALFESGLEEREWAGAVQRALADLPDEQREVLVMKLWGGLTFPQIGAALEVSPNTAAGRYRYGVAALRKAMGVDSAGQDGSREVRAIS